MTHLAATGDVWVPFAFTAMIIAMIALAYYLTNRTQFAIRREQLREMKEGHIQQTKQNNDYHAAMMKRTSLESELHEVQLEIARIELISRRAETQKGGVTQAELNKLVAAKLAKENELLESQVELARRDLAMRGDQLDFHDTRMEQSRLEIESLKLQIREQMKRLDEFGSGE